MSTTTAFSHTRAQRDATALAAGPATNLLLYGGSRSGKTFLLFYLLVYRALKAPGSRHCILRRHFNSVKRSIVYDTMPKVMGLAFPAVRYSLNKTDWFITLPNGSEIWFGGLDDKERAEKILGNEYATLWYNECSEVSYQSVTVANTRLAQKTDLRSRIYYDCNPPTKRHWIYRIFFEHVDPETRKPVNPAMYAAMRMNPEDNRDNLASNYIETVLENLPERQRRRFLKGEFADDTEGAMWKRAWIDAARVKQAPPLMRILVGVDPAVSANPDSDETGIVVAGKSEDGHYYVLEDASIGIATPDEWAKAVVKAYHRHKADNVVAEVNQGGDLVARNIKAEDASVPVKSVHATRGKFIRAEPVAALYEKGLVHHVGVHDALEDQLCTWNPQTGEKSPDRMDADVWAITGLMDAASVGFEGDAFAGVGVW